MIYFAYGSNLDLDDPGPAMRAVAPTLRPLSRAWLPDHRLVYHYRSASRQAGALDVEPKRGSAVPGMLFEVSNPQALDEKEGHPHYYCREAVVTLNSAGDAIPCVTYRLRPERIRDFVAPTPAYTALVHRGYAAFGLRDRRMLDAASANREHPGVDGVFVYGTLKKGYPNERLLPQPAVAATTQGRLVDLGAFPGLLPGETTVAGEFVALDEFDVPMEALDRLEGFSQLGAKGNLYERILAEVETAAGTRLAWIYRYTGLIGPGIPVSGSVWPTSGVSRLTTR